MKILFLSDNFPPEGNAPAARLHEHAVHWVRAGHEVRVITCVPNFPAGRPFPGWRNRWWQRERVDGIEVVRVRTYMAPNAGLARRTLDFLSFMVAGFVAGLFAPRPDVIVGTSPQFFAALGAWALAAVRRVPFVFELRDLWPASIAAVGALGEGRLLRALERVELFLYRRARAVVAVTDAFRRDLARRGIDPAKVHVVGGGVDLERCAPRPRDAELAAELGLADRFVVGYVGTLGLAHALENVLEAAELARDRDDVAFLLAGPGAARAGLEAELARRGLANAVLGPALPREEVGRLWSLCDVALVHLRDAALFATVVPSKIHEAVGMGLPILLAAPAGEATALVESDGVGLCVPPEDPRALADAALRLADDDVLRQRLRLAARAAAPGHGRDRRAAEMLTVLAEVVEAAGGTPVDAAAGTGQRAA